MKALGQIFALLSVLLLVSGCGEQEGIDEGLLDKEAHSFFTLLNAAGAEAPEVIPEIGKAPIGALVVLGRGPNNTIQPSLCSVTHMVPGVILTASHCIFRFLNQTTYVSVVFYDRDGKLTSRRATAAYVLGAPLQRDVAFLRLDKADLNWDSWSDSMSDFAKSAVPPARGSFKARMWALDPVSHVRRSPASQQFGFAMRVVPRDFIGDRNFPVLERARTPVKGWESILNMFSPTTPLADANLLQIENMVKENFFYFDGFNRPWIEGNSGSLIATQPSDNSAALSPTAIASHIYVWPEDKRYSATNLNYIGPAGKRTMSGKDAASQPLFGAGAIIDANLFKSEQANPATAVRFDTH